MGARPKKDEKLLRRALITQPLHGHVENDQLEVFGNLHVVDCEMDGVLGEVFAFATRVAKHSEGFHSQLVTHL